MENFNYKVIYRDNLHFNLSQFADKKIFLMVKSNAYGHGLEEIVKLANPYVFGYGVVNIDEALKVRKLTRKRVIIFAPTKEFEICKKNNIEFLVQSEGDLKDAISFGCQNLLHLSVNVGMNRYGLKSEIELRAVEKILLENKVKLRSIYTHFPRLENYVSTMQAYRKFVKLKNLISQKCPICFGGSAVYYYPFEYEFLRLGIEGYGYGKKGKKVMAIYSQVLKINFVKRGEYVGYGKKFKEPYGSYFAVVPVGYGDGLSRNLSNKFKVKINGVEYCSVGNICMDCFFVRVDKSVKVGDKVEVMADADYFAKKLKTIPYEILTNFSLLRGKTVIKP